LPELDLRSQDLVISLIDALRPMSWPDDIDATRLTFIDPDVIQFDPAAAG
jgi:hypothetical protein